MKTKKRFFALALCSAFLILASVVGATAAWFTSSASVAGTAKTGTLSLTVTIGDKTYQNDTANLDAAFSKENIMPGDSVCDTIEIKVTTTDPNGAYVRVSFSIDGAGDIDPTLGANWHDGGDGYYYYGTKAAPLAMTAEQKSIILWQERQCFLMNISAFPYIGLNIPDGRNMLRFMGARWHTGWKKNEDFGNRMRWFRYRFIKGN